MTAEPPDRLRITGVRALLARTFHWLRRVAEDQVPVASCGMWDALGTHCPTALPTLRAAVFQLATGLDFKAYAIAMQLSNVQRAVDPSALPRVSGVLAHAARSRRLAYVGGRLCAEQALRQGGASPQLEIGRGPTGDPRWPAGWIGSISHSSAIAVAAVARADSCIGMGIDVEPLLSPADSIAVLSMCTGDAERDQLRREVNSTVATTVLFATKEAYFKAAFPVVGRFVDFTEVSVDFADGMGDRVYVHPNGSDGSSVTLPRAYGRWSFLEDAVFVCVAICDMKHGE